MSSVLFFIVCTSMRADTAKSDRRRDRLGRRGACTPREKADGASRRGRQTEQLLTVVVALGRCKPAIRRMCALHCDVEGSGKCDDAHVKVLQISTKGVVSPPIVTSLTLDPTSNSLHISLIPY